jgi:hypothetical protein
MINAIQLTDKLKTYVISQLDTMSKTTPMVSFMKPFITRALNKNFSKLTGILDMIADNEGNIDVDGILSEMMESIRTTQPFIFKTSFVGDIEIGGGAIKLNIPLTDKRLAFNMSDLENFKGLLTSKD